MGAGHNDGGRAFPFCSQDGGVRGGGGGIRGAGKLRNNDCRAWGAAGGGLAVHALGDALLVRAVAGLPGVHVNRGRGRGQNRTRERYRGGRERETETENE